MKLSELFADLFEVNQAASSVLLEREVTAICIDSRKLVAGGVFVALRGTKSDGHRYLTQAAAAGVLALVVEDDADVPRDFRGVVVVVADSRKALSQLAARFNGQPSIKMRMIGVTGTNGKTTTTHMIEAILEFAGMPTGVIGTIDHHLRSKVWSTDLTTPDAVAFHSRLKEMSDLGAKAVALEVSSHALQQGRVDEVAFDIAIFTNLSRDHLDYHGDMEQYFKAKALLFHSLLPRSPKSDRFMIVNIDDNHGRALHPSKSITCWRYGRHPDAEFCFDVIDQGFGGTRFRLQTPQGAREIRLQMPGVHNVYNACGAIAAALAVGISFDACVRALESFSGVKGRLESVANKNGIYVFIDYAHTDGALEAVLQHLRAIRASAGLENKIITLFGCGGDRDKGKRPLMTQAALRGSDFVVLTSDNPRTEDPQQIMNDALQGIDPALALGKLFKEIDRRAGIARALKMAQPGDVVLIAGKGHEDYQEIGAVRQPFSDFAVARTILEELK
jgi:UDP-N-acetylmuramoyl-L-alanyl-D-glutamate--2,6-diaminopimelate ligase